MRLLLAAVAAALVLVGCGGSADPSSQRVTVAAASDLRYAFDDIVALAAEQRPDLEVAVTYGSSGQFLQQVANGAPFDLYLSADIAYPQQLVDDSLADAAELFPYAVGRLVLWVPDGSPLDPADGLQVLRNAERISIANPEHAPYGRAAVAALEAAGLYDDVADRLVLGENVAQAAEFVTTGNADAGIVALSLVLSDPLRDVGTWWQLPLEAFPRIDQGGLVLSDSDAARFVRDVLLSEPGREILARYGFSLPGDPLPTE
jgi:molybdate transport system substrate-binding protein